jgi:hypothetical protein
MDGDALSGFGWSVKVLPSTQTCVDRRSETES